MLRRSLLAAPLILTASSARADWTPKQPIKILVGYAPGGTADIAARVAADSLARQHGYNVIVDGESSVIGGTSAVAPLWAGLIALINQSIGKPAGFINPLLYQAGDSSGDFNDITSGNNGAYSAQKGWDACTGLGSPIGSEVASVLGAPSAQTKTA